MDRTDARLITTRVPLDPGHLRIRRAEPSDHEAVARTMGTPWAQRGTLQLPYPSIESWRERMAKVDGTHCMLVAEAHEPALDDAPFEVVGNLGLHPSGPSLRRSHAWAIGMSVRDDWQGRGIGSALMAAALDRADRWMNVLRIELTVFVDNQAAIALYRRSGFTIEGRHRAYALRDGAYVDAYAMARLHPNPPVLPAPLPETVER